MKIETKYDIGQEVWFTLCEGRIFSSPIGSIVFDKDGLFYNVVGYGTFKEYELFPTKEELLKSLDV